MFNWCFYGFQYRKKYSTIKTKDRTIRKQQYQIGTIDRTQRFMIVLTIVALFAVCVAETVHLARLQYKETTYQIEIQNLRQQLMNAYRQRQVQCTKEIEFWQPMRQITL